MGGYPKQEHIWTIINKNKSLQKLLKILIGQSIMLKPIGMSLVDKFVSVSIFSAD